MVTECARLVELYRQTQQKSYLKPADESAETAQLIQVTDTLLWSIHEYSFETYIP